MNAFSTQTMVESRVILALGLTDNFYELVYGNGIKEEHVQPVFFNDSYKAFRWLEKNYKNGSSELPYAILCDYQFLEEDNFRILDSIRKSPELSLIPFVAITDADVKVDARECLLRGMDDCYTRPVDWSDLRRRVEFLNQHKAEILQQNPNAEVFEFKISPTKRVFDILFASLAILALSPILLLVAILIKLESKGPVIYKSKRVGTGYQHFDFLKFRSMVVDADAKLAQLAHLNHYGKGENAAFVKLNNDPRVTKIGKFIRKTSFDELPQLFNVLKGEMSIVGNRPLPIYEAEQMTRDEWAKRFLAPAGLTGLWQVNPKGKDNLSVEERIGLDIEYAETNNFWMDIKIISRTLPAMIQKED